MIQCHLYVEVRLNTSLISLKGSPRYIWQKDMFQDLWIKGVQQLPGFCLAFKVLQLGKQNGRKGADSDLSSLSIFPLGNFLALERCVSNRLHQPSVFNVLSLWL